MPVGTGPLSFCYAAPVDMSLSIHNEDLQTMVRMSVQLKVPRYVCADTMNSKLGSK